MTHFGINGTYFQHSTPEYNAAHKKENSEYNAKYYQAHKEKWGVKDDSKSGSSSDSKDDDKDEDEKNKKKKSKGKSIEDVISKLNGGSKATGKGSSKKSSSSKDSSKNSTKDKKKEETEEEKKEREAKEAKEAEETRKKNDEYNENLKKMWTNYNKILEERKKKKTVKHYAINSENYLKHHGIDNQRWGVRHGPPYPLAKGVANAIKRGAQEGLKQGGKQAKNYAIQNSIRPVTDKIQKKEKPQKFDVKKIATGALIIAGSAVATGILSKLVDYGVDKAVEGGKVAAGNILMRAPHEGLANVGVNILLDAARSRR